MTPSTRHVYKDGIIRWYSTRITMQLHREDGPSVTYPDGTNFWHRHGELHREDGPAIMYPNGSMIWAWRGTTYGFHIWCEEAGKTEDEIVYLKLKYGSRKHDN